MNSWGTNWKDNGYLWVSYATIGKIAPGEWCTEAHIIKVVDENLPRPVTLTNKAKGFILQVDKRVTELSGVALTRPNFAERATATADWLYLLTPDEQIITRALIVDKGKNIQFDEMINISTYSFPDGLKRGGVIPRIRMLASSGAELFALGRDGVVYQRIPAPPLPKAEWRNHIFNDPAIDLRDRGTFLTVTLRSGKVLRWDSAARRWLAFGAADISSD